jgi:hypothetical protein
MATKLQETQPDLGIFTKPSRIEEKGGVSGKTQKAVSNDK